MGQYYAPGCADNGQWLYTHTFGDGLKLMEFGCSRHGTLTAIALLLAIPGEKERGQWTGHSPLMGAWAGKRLVIGGDYADEGRFVPPEHQDLNFYGYVDEHGEDISLKAIQAIVDVAGPGHPLAPHLSVKEGERHSSFKSAPEGMASYMDLTKAASLSFDSLEQLFEFSYAELGETRKGMEVELGRALYWLGLKFDLYLRGEVTHLVLNESADGERIESMQFFYDDKIIHWTFPIRASELYKSLGIKKK